MEEMTCEITFTDITLNETDGVFEEVKEIMLKEPPFNDNWVIRSNVSVGSPVGQGEMEIQCHGDGGLYILDYKPSIGDVFYNPDIQVFSTWAQQNGWKVPQPSADLAKSNKPFWKHFYDTLLIDCDYFDKLYGVRPQFADKEKK